MPAVSTRTLRFDPALSKKDLKKLRDNLSAIVLGGDHLWLGGDEGTSIHRMTRETSGDFGGHTTFGLMDILALPGGTEEIDIEGLALDSGYLWLVGSHSAKRKKAEEDRSEEDNIQRLATLELEGNRFTLGRVPLDDSGTPTPRHGALTAARLEGDATANQLTVALRTDEHLGRFAPGALPNDSIEGIPGKDNGFDVEGLAVSGDRVFLGLRGPVLRGWATILELRLGTAANGVLSLTPFGTSRKRYLKHFLRLDGLGIRELVVHGSDLLVLAGPSMDLDVPVFIYRWAEALNQHADSLTWDEHLPKLVTVPFGDGKDHAEGLSLVSSDPLSVMVCYDSPGTPHAVAGETHAVAVDVFEITP